MARDSRAYKILCSLYQGVLKRQRFGSLRRKEAPSTGRKRPISLEPLEQRVLLSGATPWVVELDDLNATAVTVGLNPDNQHIEVSDGSGLLDSRPLVDTVSLDILGNNGVAVDESVTVDASLFGRLPILFDGREGSDTLVGPDLSVDWRVTGPDAGHIDAFNPNPVSFSGVENLTGGVDNEDNFILTEGASISGKLEGGAGGFDTLVIEGGSFRLVSYHATGPDSGTVRLDAAVVAYSGLEPIVDDSGAVDRILTTSASADIMSLSDGPASGQLTLDADNGAFETHTFTAPRLSIRINADAGDDTINLNTLLEYSEAVFIDGGDGVDTVDVSGLVGSYTIIGHSDGSFTITDGAQSFGVINVENFTGPHSVLSEQGIPDWQEQGSGPIANAQLAIPPDNIATAAVHAIAPHPRDPNVLFVGSVNGGVWRNTDRTVLFEFDSTVLTPATQSVLNQYARFLLEHPDVHVEVGGHTDSVGDVGFNQTLSLNRAQSVGDHLMAQGVPASQLTVTGFGETRGVASNSTDEGRRLNRRVELIANFWQPLIDQFPSLAVGSVAVSPLDNAEVAVTDATTVEELVV